MIPTNKLTTEKFIERAIIIHGNKYNYDKTTYIRALSKVEIVCSIHGNFWQRAASHLRGHECQGCERDNRFCNTNDFIRRSREIHGNFYDYSKAIYTYGKNKITIMCPVHGEFEQRANSHLKGKGCLKCGIDATKLGLTNFIEIANKIHDNKYNYDKVAYTTNKAQVIICCPIHGQFKQAPNDHLRNGGCKKCGVQEQRKKITLTRDQFITLANIKHSNFYSYDKSNYIHSHTLIIITCPTHGDFSQDPGNHLADNGCPSCRSSISKIGSQWLDMLNIPNDRDHREVAFIIKDRKFKVDGFINDTNTVYEFYGDYWHGNPTKFDPNKESGLGDKTYGDLYRATIEREKLIKEAGYNIISIWESDWRKTS